MYSHKRNAGASGDRPDGEMGVRKAEAEEMDNGQLTIDNWEVGAAYGIRDLSLSQLR